MYDTLIIGSGIASISAALTLKIRNKSFLIFGNKDLSPKIYKTHQIKNYPGLSNISGEDLKLALLKQLNDEGIEIIDKQINAVYKMSNSYVAMANQDMYEAKTVLIATGVINSSLIEGEEALLGQGVSYCATCDGFLYKDKEIAIILSDEQYLEEVSYLSSIASKVYLITNINDLNIHLDNVEIINSNVTKITKEDKICLHFNNNQPLKINGLFILRNAIAPSYLVPGIKCNNNHIEVNRNQETNLEGCYAAGDITGTPYQYAKAIGEGNVAALSIVSYLSKSK